MILRPKKGWIYRARAKRDQFTGASLKKMVEIFRRFWIRMSDPAKRRKKCTAILSRTLCLLSLTNNGKLYSQDKDKLTTAAAFVVRESY